MAKDLQIIIEDELDAAGKDGQQEGRKVIETSGTQKEWTTPFNGRTSGGQGRIESGHMDDAMDYRVIRGQQVGLDVGWIRIWEEYFGAQDRGFDALGYRRPSASGNDHVVGMGVMAHLHVFMRARVDTAMDRSVERIIDGL
jgi:hypothetical protein